MNNDKILDRAFAFLMIAVSMMLLAISFGIMLPDAIESWRRVLS